MCILVLYIEIQTFNAISMIKKNLLAVNLETLLNCKVSYLVEMERNGYFQQYLHNFKAWTFIYFSTQSPYRSMHFCRRRGSSFVPTLYQLVAMSLIKRWTSSFSSCDCSVSGVKWKPRFFFYRDNLIRNVALFESMAAKKFVVSQLVPLFACCDYSRDLF